MALTIRSLLEGRDKPLSVAGTVRLSDAIELMLRHDYTQLPVADADGRLKGIISSDSILRTIDAFGLEPSQLIVADAMVKTRSFDPDGDIAELLDGLRDQYVAIVVDSEDKLIGIVTGFDASEYFRRRAEDMMLVEDIEASVKEHILSAYVDAGGLVDQVRLDTAITQTAGSGDRALRGQVGRFLAKYNAAKGFAASANDEALVEQLFADAFGPSKIPDFADLSLGNYIELLLHKSIWDSYKDVFGLAPVALRRLLNDVRETRNDLAHFRRSDISAAARAKLRFCAAWLERHPPRRSSPPAPAAASPPSIESANEEQDIAMVAPNEEELEPGQGRYAKLAMFLQGFDPLGDVTTLEFTEIEEIIGSKLPPSARAHRSWWANDSVSHPQSKQWLEVGWRVLNVSLSEQVVVFARIREREAEYIRFFSKVIARIRSQGIPIRESSPSGVNWHNFVRIPADGPGIGVLSCSFARGARLRVEVYIDTGAAEINKTLFDRLLGERVELEHALGEGLSWERLDTRRACRVAVYRPGSISDTENWPAMIDWCINRLIALRERLIPVLEKVAKELGHSESSLLA